MPADIEAALENDVSPFGECSRKSTTEQYAAMTLPKTLPPDRALRGDTADMRWVQDYPRAGSVVVTGRVFASDGRPVAVVVLPAALNVYEIDLDYVLGRAIDEDDGAPEVQLFALRRTPAIASPTRRSPL